MKIHSIIVIVLSLFVASELSAQYSVQPAPAQEGPVLLTNVTLHVGTGDVIENGVLGFDQGVITIAGSDDGFDRSGYQVMDMSGKHVYPGFILLNTQLGLNEVASVRATIDQRETGTYNPNVRSIIAYNTDSEIIPTFRFNGILMAQVVPQGGTIPGSSSVVQLDAWNWEDAAVKMDEGVHVNWPSRNLREFSFATFSMIERPNPNYTQQIAEVKELFAESKAYMTMKPEVNIKLEAMTGLFDGSKTLYIHKDNAKESIEAIQFAKSMGVQKIVLVGGEEAFLIAEFLTQENIPVVLTNIHDLPGKADYDVDLPFKLPHMLKEAGVDVCITYNESLARQRNLAFTAGTAAAYGLSKEEALEMITLKPARILGIDDQVGSLESGKQATFFVSDGDALDMRTQVVRHAFIQGRKLMLDGMQQALYKKYADKYGLETEE